MSSIHDDGFRQSENFHSPPGIILNWIEYNIHYEITILNSSNSHVFLENIVLILRINRNFECVRFFRWISRCKWKKKHAYLRYIITLYSRVSRLDAFDLAFNAIIVSHKKPNKHRLITFKTKIKFIYFTVVLKNYETVGNKVVITLVSSI